MGSKVQVAGFAFHRSKDIISTVTAEKIGRDKGFECILVNRTRMILYLNSGHIWFNLPRAVCRPINYYSISKKSSCGRTTTVSSFAGHSFPLCSGFGISWAYFENCGLPKTSSYVLCFCD